MLPLNKDKNGDDFSSGMIYLFDNLGDRGVKPEYIEEAWAQYWALENVYCSHENGYDLKDYLNDEEEISKEGIELVAKGLFELKLIGEQACNQLKNRELEKAGLDIEYSILKEKNDLNMQSKVKWLSAVEFWDEIKRIVLRAEEKHGALTKVKAKLIDNHPFFKPLAGQAALKNQLLLYPYNIYKFTEATTLVLHACCVDGNKIIEIHRDVKPDDYPGIVRLSDKNLYDQLVSLCEKTGVKMKNELRMPMTMSHMVNDYDTLFLTYAQRS